MPHLQGAQRDQALQLPPTLDQFIAPENPVRFLDAFVDSLDLEELGFARATPARTGRPSYPPGDLLKLFLYGYLNRTRSSRRLEKETHRNVEVMWLLKRLTPDHKTIADFRKDNLQPLKATCRQFTLLCKGLDLFGAELVVIDGSKFKACNGRDRNFTPAKVEKALKRIDQKLEAYLQEMQQADQQENQEQDAEPGLRPQSNEELQQKIAWLQGRQQWYQDLEGQLKESGESQISLTDPDSRSMPVQRGTEVCYNVQMAVDSKHKLIVAHEVRSEVTDQNQLSGMALQAKEALAVETLEVAADTGYYDGDEVKRCQEAGITAFVAKAQTSVNVKRGLFTKEDFAYDTHSDTYTCPSGAQLTFRFEAVELGREIRYYALPVAVCRGCPLRERCTRNKGGRRIMRWKHEHVLEAMGERVRARPEVLKQRQEVVEHPFGTMKRAMNAGYFLLKGRAKVGAEMSLTVLCYNLLRAVNILGVKRLIEAVEAVQTGSRNAVRWWLRLFGRLLAVFYWRTSATSA